MTTLAPTPKFGVTFVNANGETRPGIGYKLYTYLAGSSTPKDTYHDITLGSPNQNPVVMDSRGECDLWLNGSYKFILKTDLDSTVWEVDEVRDPFTGQTFTNATIAGTLTISSTAVTWSGNPTHSGNHIFSGNVSVNGNTVIGNASSDSLTVNPSSVTWNSSVTHNGAHVFTDTVTAASLNITAGAVSCGEYQPSPTGTTNVTSVAATSSTCGKWIRVGNIVHVVCTLDIDPTAALFTDLRFSLPIASTLGATSLAGVGTISSATVSISGAVIPDISNNQARYQFLAVTDLSSRTHYLTFTYRVA